MGVWHRSMLLGGRKLIIQQVLIYARLSVCLCVCGAAVGTRLQEQKKEREQTRWKCIPQSEKTPSTAARSKVWAMATNLIAAQRVKLKQEGTERLEQLSQRWSRQDECPIKTTENTKNTKTNMKHEQSTQTKSRFRYLWVRLIMGRCGSEYLAMAKYAFVSSVPVGWHNVPAPRWLRNLGKGPKRKLRMAGT